MLFDDNDDILRYLYTFLLTKNERWKSADVHKVYKLRTLLAFFHNYLYINIKSSAYIFYT